MNDLMNWETLGTLAGATGAVLLITQYIKPFLKMVNTRLIALILSMIILIAVTIVSKGSPQEYAIAILNSFLVATSAMGAYEVTFEKLDSKKEHVDENNSW